MISNDLQTRRSGKNSLLIGYKRKTMTKKRTEETHIEKRYYLCSIKLISKLFANKIMKEKNPSLRSYVHSGLITCFIDKFQKIYYDAIVLTQCYFSMNSYARRL